MNLHLLIGGSVLALCIAFSQPALADTVLYSQRPNIDGAFGSNTGQSQFVDDFTPSVSGTANKVTWYGWEQGASQPPNFTVNFYADSNGTPGSLVSSDVVSGNPVRKDPGSLQYFYTYIYNASIAPVTLAAGTPYWLSIVGNQNSDWGWWQSTDGDSKFYYAPPGGGPGVLDDAATNRNFAYTLENVPAVAATPEPSSILLLGTGVLGIVGIMRRRSVLGHIS